MIDGKRDGQMDEHQTKCDQKNPIKRKAQKIKRLLILVKTW